MPLMPRKVSIIPRTRILPPVRIVPRVKIDRRRPTPSLSTSLARALSR